MIFPCIDLLDGKVVQLVQGREKALEADSPLEMLRRFAAFPEIQVIDLNAAMGTGSNDELVRLVATHARTRVGGGVRSVDRARALIDQGAHKVIVGTAAFTAGWHTRRVPGGSCRSHRQGASDRRARFQRRPHRGQRAGARRPASAPKTC